MIHRMLAQGSVLFRESGISGRLFTTFSYFSSSSNTETIIMKNQITQLLIVLAVLSALNSQQSNAFAQGSLTPPGPPAPIMKTLEQIEPRIPISAVPYSITNPGSYYLTSNLSVGVGEDAIGIFTGGVTLDLRGFTIFSTAYPANGAGVALHSVAMIHILNGNIAGNVTIVSNSYAGAGFSYGIYVSAGCSDVNVTGVSVSGVGFNAIDLTTGNASLVESCTVNVASGIGIEADTVENSVALGCGSSGIIATSANNCYGTTTGSGYGVEAGTAISCYGSSSENDGIHAVGTAENCYGATASSGDSGLYAYTAQNCYGNSTGSGYGIFSTTATGCYGNSSAGTGLFAQESAENCYGSSSTGTGLSANSAANCYGTSGGSGVGLNANSIAQSCYGSSSAGNGLTTYSAENCFGSTLASGFGVGTGLTASLAENCEGSSVGGVGLLVYNLALNCTGGCEGSDYGINAPYMATGCFGSSGTGIGLKTQIANGCFGQNGNNSAVGLQATDANFSFGIGNPTVSVSGNKYNMP
jgi:hypothetical protein